jgi:hypothetical protein
MWLNVKFESPSSEILPKLAFNIYTRLIFSGNLGMYDSLLSEQVADKDLQRSFKYLNTSCLRTITLTHNSWGLLPNGMFHSLSRIGRIDLTGNKLRILNCTEFVYLHALFFLNVTFN